MPHTSRRKKQQSTKRVEIPDEDGWTRVTTTNGLQRKPRPLAAHKALQRKYGDDENREITYPEMTIPADRTIEGMEEQYHRLEKKWLDSESYGELKKCLTQEMTREILGEIDQCFVFGTGSFSGHTRGWIDRSHVSMLQLAAFISMVNIIGMRNGERPETFAQEPVYNHLDKEFLSRRNITTIETPAGFTAINTRSCIYTPNAELEITIRTLACNPAIAMTNGKLDMFWRNEKGEACTNAMNVHIGTVGTNSDSSEATSWRVLTAQEQGKYLSGVFKDEIEESLQVCEGFKAGKVQRLLPPFDAKDEPFYNVHIYYGKECREDIDADGQNTDKLQGTRANEM